MSVSVSVCVCMYYNFEGSRREERRGRLGLVSLRARHDQSRAWCWRFKAAPIAALKALVCQSGRGFGAGAVGWARSTAGSRTRMGRTAPWLPFRASLVLRVSHLLEERAAAMWPWSEWVSASARLGHEDRPGSSGPRPESSTAGGKPAAAAAAATQVTSTPALVTWLDARTRDLLIPLLVCA